MRKGICPKNLCQIKTCRSSPWEIREQPKVPFFAVCVPALLFCFVVIGKPHTESFFCLTIISCVRSFKLTETFLCICCWFDS